MTDDIDMLDGTSIAGEDSGPTNSGELVRATSTEAQRADGGSLENNADGNGENTEEIVNEI